MFFYSFVSSFDVFRPLCLKPTSFVCFWKQARIEAQEAAGQRVELSKAATIAQRQSTENKAAADLRLSEVEEALSRSEASEAKLAVALSSAAQERDTYRNELEKAEEALRRLKSQKFEEGQQQQRQLSPGLSPGKVAVEEQQRERRRVLEQVKAGIAEGEKRGLALAEEEMAQLQSLFAHKVASFAEQKEQLLLELAEQQRDHWARERVLVKQLEEKGQQQEEHDSGGGGGAYASAHNSSSNPTKTTELLLGQVQSSEARRLELERKWSTAEVQSASAAGEVEK
jgi:hypothetical protein